MHLFERPTTTFSLDSNADLETVIDLRFLREFLSGDHPFSCSTSLARVRDDCSLAPTESTAVLAFDSDGRSVRLHEGAGWALLAVIWKDRSARVSVTAKSDALAQLVLEDATHGASEEPPQDDEHAAIGFWNMGPHGPRRYEKRIAIRPWQDIRRNYTAGVTDAFDQLMDVGPSDIEGKLLLLHGPPGTGKTTALRALAHSWRSWCSVEYVLDPERLLHNPTYLLEAAGSGDDDEWVLLVLEDCDEVIRGDAKAAAGQALSRLLNLTDGILGQGLDVLVALTTNEPLNRLHPAVVRPGRCLAQVEVGPLSAEEAARWLGHPVGSATSTFTVAELYEHTSGRTVIEATSSEEVRSGYL